MFKQKVFIKTIINSALIIVINANPITLYTILVIVIKNNTENVFNKIKVFTSKTHIKLNQDIPKKLLF